MNLWNQFKGSSPLAQVVIIAVAVIIIGGACFFSLFFLFDVTALWRSAAQPTPTQVALVPTVAPPTPLPTPVVITGWQGEYFDNPDLQGEPVVVQNDEYIDFDWGTDPPAPGVPAENFSVRWTISRDVPAGTYLISVRHDSGVRVWVDDQLIIDQWRPGPVRDVEAVVNVVAGTRSVRMDYFHTRGNAVAQLAVEHQQNFPDWKAEYFDNPSLAGNPVAVFNETVIDYDWGAASPLPGVVPDDDYSIRWSRLDEFEDGTYIFRVQVEGGVRVLLDGQPIIDNWLPDPLRDMEASSQLSAGEHSLQVEYFKQTGNGQIRFGWVKANEPSQPPVAVINGPNQGQTGQPVNFNALGSAVAVDNTIVSNAWDFGDGTTATGIYVSHVYNAPGTYQVSLTVTDNQDLSNTTTHQISIVTVEPTPPPDQPPRAIIVGPSNARVGEAVVFNGSASICPTPCVSYAWQMGDGTNINAVQLQHTYETPGIYNVILTVTDQNGLVGSANTQIQITQPASEAPIAVISAPAQAEVGQSVTFDASNSQSTNPIVSYLWQFGDGSEANAVTVQHAYANTGIFNVILIVTDNQGLSGATNYQIQINQAAQTPTATTEPIAPTATQEPTQEPTAAPTEPPTVAPTTEPPPVAPTEPPTAAPTEPPTVAPTEQPTAAPTTEPPTVMPTTESPTVEP